MAKLDVVIPDDWLSRLSRLEENTEPITRSMLEAGGNIAVGAVRSNLRSAVGSNTKKPSRSTGELMSSLGVSPVKRDRNGDHDIKVGFREPRRGGGSPNARIANVLEHGRHGQPPRPFLRPAKASSRQAVINAMQSKFDEEINRI